MTRHAARVIRAAALPAGTPEVPVGIVGAGACGLTAALMLRDAGIDCALLERDAAPQGSTALSSGFIPAAGTRAQRAAGVTDDSAARFAADIQAKAHGTAAPQLVAAYSEAIAPALDALEARHGLASSCSTASCTPATGAPHAALPQRTGAALMAALQLGRPGCRCDAADRGAGARALGRCAGSRARARLARPDDAVEHLRLPRR